jgi:hypothetical protein
MGPRVRRHLLAAAAAFGGIVLFAWAIRNVGWADVAAGIRRVGWGLLPILVISGARFAVRAECWRRCMAPAGRISRSQAFVAYLAGDAIGNVTPLGLIASEPTKVFLTRHRLATREAASSLAVDLFIYATSVVTMIGVGLVALSFTIPLAAGGRAAILATLVALAGGVAFAFRLAGGTWDVRRGARPGWRATLASLRESVLSFSAGHPARLWRVFLLHLGFHALSVFELFLTLRWLVGEEVTVAQALVFSALDRFVIVAFKFVPFRIGVDEASSGWMTALLGWGGAVGVTLGIIKKVRSLAWTGVGLLLIAAHPAREAPATDPRGSGPWRQT